MRPGICEPVTFEDMIYTVTNNTWNDRYHHNYFENIMGQANATTACGISEIRGKDNVFLYFKIFDYLYEEHPTIVTIHPNAQRTVIFGGHLIHPQLRDGDIENGEIENYSNEVYFFPE